MTTLRFILFYARMLLLDVLIRYSAVTMLFLTAGFALRDARGSAPTPYIVLTTVTVAFMLLGCAPPELRLPGPLHAGVRILDVGNVVFAWWMGLSLFQDDFRLRWFHWAVLAATAALLVPCRLLELQGQVTFPALTKYLINAITFTIMGHLAYVALIGRVDDLVEPRRRMRVVFVMAVIVTTLTAMMIENFLPNDFGQESSILRAVIIFPIALFALTWLMRLQPENIVFAPVKKVEPQGLAIDPRDKLLLQRLTDAMELKKVFTEPRLTIRSLAEQLNTPEHRLRALINQGLGFRNFSAYLNNYRIMAVKSAFSDPELSRVPVLTIAMDVGFNSLAPFNRAFRDAEGMTPTAYRQKFQTLAAE